MTHDILERYYINECDKTLYEIEDLLSTLNEGKLSLREIEKNIRKKISNFIKKKGSKIASDRFFLNLLKLIKKYLPSRKELMYYLISIIVVFSNTTNAGNPKTMQYINSSPTLTQYYNNADSQFINITPDTILSYEVDELYDSTFDSTIKSSAYKRYVNLNNIVDIDTMTHKEKGDFVMNFDSTGALNISFSIDDNQREFLDAIAKKESNNNSDTYNRLGYMGKYQIGKRALDELGLSDSIKLADFKNSPDTVFPEQVQDQVMMGLIARNQHYLKNLMKNRKVKLSDYIGKKINGVTITKTGIYAAAHLVGAKSVADFLVSNGSDNRKDANGVSALDYMKLFQKYKF